MNVFALRMETNTIIAVARARRRFPGTSGDSQLELSSRALIEKEHANTGVSFRDTQVPPDAE